MNSSWVLSLLIFALLLSSCGFGPEPAAKKNVADYQADDFLRCFVNEVEGSSFVKNRYEIETPDPEDEYTKLIRFEGKKILIVSFQDDGLVCLSAFNTFEEQKDACLSFFASVLAAFFAGSEFEEDLTLVRSSYESMGTNNTKSVFRDYIQVRMVTEADDSAETGGYVYFIVGKNG